MKFDFDILQKTDDEKIALMFTAFFCYNIITLLINTIVNFFLPNTPVDTVICFGIYVFFIINALAPVARRISAGNIIFVAICVLVYLFHCIIYTDNAILLFNFMPTFIFTVLPLYFLGAAIRDYKILLDYFEKASHFMVFVAFAYYIILIVSNQKLIEDNMSFAYYFLPFAVISFYSFISISVFSLPALLRMVLSFITLVLTGTRGPLLCLAVGIVLIVLFYRKNKVKKFFLVIALIAFVLFLFSPAFIKVIEGINNYLLSHDIENRIISKILKENFMDGSGRDTIKDVLRNAILERPVFGYGIMGDRVLVNTYAHNLLYELMIDFGVIVGSVLFLIVLFATIKNVFSTVVTKEYKIILVLLVSVVFVKLFVSGSYIQESIFFLLLGMLFCNKNAKGIVDNT